MDKDANPGSDPDESLAGVWFRLLAVEHVTESQLKFPADRDFIAADTPLFVVAATSEGRLVVDGRYAELRAGAVRLCKPGQLIEPGLQAGDEQGLYIVRFHMAELARPTGKTAALKWLETFPAEEEAFFFAPSVVLPLCKTLLAHWSSASAADRFRGEAGFCELLGLVQDQREHRTSMALECAKLVLEQRYREEITIHELAETTGLSRYHFMRLFKEKFGKGVIEYVTELRLREAKRLMQEQSGPALRDIAYRVGYKNETYFSRMFKKYTGMPPAVYLQNRKTKVAAYSWVNIGQLLALRTIPYAAPIDHYWTDFYRSRYSFDVLVPLSHQYDFNREALRKSPPDYIVGMDTLIDKAEQEKLGRIAPALFLSKGLDWRQHLTAVAEFLNKADEAADWLRRYDRKAAAVREAARRSVGDGTVLVVLVHRQQLLVWGRRAGTVLYDDAGLAPARHVEDIVWTRPVEAQQLADFDADHLLVNVTQDAVSHAAWQRLSRSAGWRELKAVKAGRVRLTAGYAGWEAPWNEYAAFNQDGFLDVLSRLF